MTYIKVVFLLYILLLVGCKVASPIPNTNDVYIEYIKDKDSNSENFINKFTKALKFGVKNVYIQEGIYDLSTLSLETTLKNDINIVGLGNVVINVKKNFGYFKSPIFSEFTLNDKLKRDDNILKISNQFISKASNQKLSFFILSDSIVENGWKYKKGETHPIIKIENSNIYLEDSLLFNYSKNEKAVVKIFQNYKFSIENLTFVVNEKNNSWSYDQILRTDGCVIDAKAIKVTNKKEEKSGLFWGMYYCNDIHIDGFTSQNLLYGLCFDYSRNIFVKNIVAQNTHHPVVPSTFSKNVYITNLTGKNTCIDAHLAFNVNYSNVNIDSGKDYFNCRSFGVRLNNCNFKSDENFKKENIEIGVYGLTDEYKFLYNKYDIIIDSVNWVHTLMSFNGLHVNKCKNFIIKNSITHQISTENPIERFLIDSCKIGRVYCYDANLTVKNTIFDADLQRRSDILDPISISYSGIALFENCRFVSFRKNIFSFISSPESNVTFRNCNFGAIRNFVNRFEYPNYEYNNVRFENSNISNMTKIPSEFRNNKFIK